MDGEENISQTGTGYQIISILDRVDMCDRTDGFASCGDEEAGR